MNLLDHDIQMFRSLQVSLELLELAGVVRVTNTEAREVYGITRSGDMSGIAFPYYDPATMANGQPRRWYVRIRRDNPDVESGKIVNKYISPDGRDRKHLYFPPIPEVFADNTVPVVLVEAEKSVLALTASSWRNNRKVLTIGLGGCYGWRGRIGKVDGPSGERLDEKGALPELRVVCCKGRDVYVMLDSNVNFNLAVKAARSALSRELLSYGARVFTATIPAIPGVNGADDLVGQAGDSAIESVLELAVAALDVAVADVESLIAKIKKAHPHHDPEDVREAFNLIADVTDELQRQVLQNRLAEAVRRAVPKKMVIDEIDGRRKDRKKKEEAFAAANRRSELLRRGIDLSQLILDLEQFLLDRAVLPEGAALVCALFALNTWVFDAFDATPYICLESATPRCGKSTVMRLIAALSPLAMVVTSMSEAIFRILHLKAPTLCVDEAESLEGRTDRAESLRAILNEGYKKGGSVPRCVGEEHEVQFFRVFSPKIFCVIGGLTGALLDRCLVIHMDRAPKGSKRKSTRIRAITRDSQSLREQLEAYEIQYRDELKKLYEAEPDEGYWPGIVDREAELWSPLLYHARIAGAAIEARLLQVIERFGSQKGEIEAQDTHTAKAIALLDALKKVSGDEFSPGDLVESLSGTDAWAYAFAKVKGSDDKTRERSKALAVGYALRKFRLAPIKKSSSGSSLYDKNAAMDVIGRLAVVWHRTDRSVRSGNRCGRIDWSVGRIFADPKAVAPPITVTNRCLHNFALFIRQKQGQCIMSDMAIFHQSSLSPKFSALLLSSVTVLRLTLGALP